MCTSLFTWYPGRRRRPCSRRTRASTRAEIWSSQSVSHSDCSSFSQSYCMYCRFADLISEEKEETLSVWHGTVQERRYGQVSRSVSHIVCTEGLLTWSPGRRDSTRAEKRSSQSVARSACHSVSHIWCTADLLTWSPGRRRRPCSRRTRASTRVETRSSSGTNHQI